MISFNPFIRENTTLETANRMGLEILFLKSVDNIDKNSIEIKEKDIQDQIKFFQGTHVYSHKNTGSEIVVTPTELMVWESNFSR